MTTSPYTLSDSGIHGPGLGSAPISLEQFRQEPDTLLLALNQAYGAGWLDGCKAAKPTIDAYKAVAESGTSLMRAMLERADAATDAKALDPMLADMGLVLPQDQRQREFIGSHDDLQPVRKGES